MKAVVIPPVLALMLSAAPVAAQDILPRFLGGWSGDGTVRPNGFGAPEKIRCKLSGVRDNPLQISFSGRCATPSGAGEFRMLLAGTEAGDLFAASVRLASGGDAIAFRGRLLPGAVAGVELGQKAPVSRNGRTLTSVITITFPDQQSMILSDVVTDLSDNTAAVALSLRFHMTAAQD